MFPHKVSLIAPAHNEAGCIESFVMHAKKAFEMHNVTGEILIVNDASTDETGKILKNLEKKVKTLRVIHHTRNKGLTGAMVTGIENAAHEYIVFMPSDLECHPEEDLPKLLAPLSNGYDMVAGYKNHKTRGFVKGLSAKGFNLLSRIIFNTNIKDMGWIKSFRKDVYYNVEALRSDWHRFFVFLAKLEGYKIKQVPTNFYPRRSGKSHFGKFGFRRVSGALLDMIVVRFLASFSKRPMRVFGTIAALFLTSGFLLGLYLIILGFFIEGSVIDRVPLVLMDVLLIFIGIQLFATGFVAELIVAFNERRNRVND